MGKIMLFSNKFISWVFYVITIRSYMDVFNSFLTFTDAEVLGIRNVCSIIVAIFASGYWIIKGVNALQELPYKKMERQMNKEKLEFEKKVRERKENERNNIDYEQIY